MGAYVGKMPPHARPLNASAAPAVTPDSANATPAPPRDALYILKMDGPPPARRKPHEFLQLTKARQDAGSNYIPVSIASTSVPVPVRAQKQLLIAILTLGMSQDATAPMPSPEIEMAGPSQSVPVTPQRRSRAAFLRKLGPVPSPSVSTVVTPSMVESVSVASSTADQPRHTPTLAALEQSKSVSVSPFKPKRTTPILEPKESAGPTVRISYFR